MLHSRCRRRKEVDSRLLVVGSQIVSLTLGRSFAHNLGCRCPNCSCEAILDIYTSRPFQWYKEHLNARFFDPWTRALSFRESRRTLSSHFWECGIHPHTYPKVGLRQGSSYKPKVRQFDVDDFVYLQRQLNDTLDTSFDRTILRIKVIMPSGVLELQRADKRII